MSSSRRTDMTTTRHIAFLLGATGIALFALSGEQTYSQGNDPNAYPNPYKMQENWAKLPAGRKWGSTIGVDIDPDGKDRKSTRLNSSHGYISYAVFCLKKKKTTNVQRPAGHSCCAAGRCNGPVGPPPHHRHQLSLPDNLTHVLNPTTLPLAMATPHTPV